MLKISGEGFCKAGSTGVDLNSVEQVARQILEVHELDREVAVVVGAGNLVRGATYRDQGMVAATADYMGMVATLINALALQDTLERLGVETRVMSAIEMGQVCEPYIRRRAVRHLEKGRIVIMAGGTGNPFFTTDTAAALRATEIGADVLLKATQVDGVYTADPQTNPDARRFETLTFMEVIREQYRVMDMAAVDLCMNNDLPIIVFNLWEAGNMKRVVLGEEIGTLIHCKKD